LCAKRNGRNSKENKFLPQFFKSGPLYYVK
jgi:hypothetical protein